ncbi:formate transporter FocA [Tolumonas lignilytica]|uniref:formate transporter FocA n=1 Tax=Tolumonas lignilytica TaxID=1283284 RepID=UPI000464AAF8|nr:formate transporter FocA [Tolumonas lignilytica]
MKAESPFDCLKPEAIAAVAEDIVHGKATKPAAKAFMLAITAGAFIAIAFVFYITAVSTGNNKLVGGICFSLGLILCVLLGGELFTSTTLTIVARAAKRITWGQMFKNWGIVYFGNLIGGLIIVALIMLSSQYSAGDASWGKVALGVAQHKIHHTFVEAVALGIMCNLMVCLATWMAFGGRTMLDKALIMVLPVAMFVASGFEHSIANMFMIPVGIAIENFASPAFWQAIGAQQSAFADLTIHNFIINNLIPVTIGNIIGGGVMVGLTNWFIFRRHH